MTYYGNVTNYMGWKTDPEEKYCTCADFERMLRSQVQFNVKISQLPRLLDSVETFFVKRFTKNFTTHKPNLVVATCSAVLEHAKTHAGPPACAPNHEFLSFVADALHDVDFVLPRNPIKKALFSDDGWKFFVCKPLENGPFFIERPELYETNIGTIGHLYEKNIVDKEECPFSRCYAIVRGNLSGKRLLLTGEVDAVDDNGPVEIKTRPAWAQYSGRDLETLLQSTLGCVKTIVTGVFLEKGKKSLFPAERMRVVPTEVFGEKLLTSLTKKLDRASDIFDAIKTTCKPEIVYAVEGNHETMKITPVERNFPVDRTILANLARACVKRA